MYRHSIEPGSVRLSRSNAGNGSCPNLVVDCGESAGRGEQAEQCLAEDDDGPRRWDPVSRGSLLNFRSWLKYLASLVSSILAIIFFNTLNPALAFQLTWLSNSPRATASYIALNPCSHRRQSSLAASPLIFERRGLYSVNCISKLPLIPFLVSSVANRYPAIQT